jgi:thioesterase domain-containing protein/acyl carrier protein
MARSAAEIRRWIVEEVARTLKVGPCEVDPAAPLDSLGVDSLGAIGMSGGLAAYIGKDVPATLMWDYPTINAIAVALADEEPLAQALIHPGVINLQTQGSRTPIFFFPGMGGHPLTFTNLATRLGSTQPCYGLTVPGLDGDSPPLETVEAMAAAMVQTLRRVQPTGPYQLAGYSFGGLLAYEAARQLTAAGQSVGLLAIYDTFAPGGKVTRPLWQRLIRHGYLLLTRTGRIAYVRGRVRRLRNTITHRPENVTPDAAADGTMEERVKIIQKLNRRATDRYKPLPYDGSTVLFLAAHRPDYVHFYKIDPTAGWGAHCKGQVQIVTLPGSHFTLLNAANAGHAAAALLPHLIDAPSNRNER